MAGRPSSFTQEIADKICTEIATSNKSLRTICAAEDMPDATTVLRWVRDNEEFRKQYAHAKEEQADFLAEEMLEIADDGTKDDIIVPNDGNPYTIENKEWTNRSRLRVDTRKWLASKLKPKKYGEKLDIVSDGQRINMPTQIIFKGEDVTPIETKPEKPAPPKSQSIKEGEDPTQ